MSSANAHDDTSRQGALRRTAQDGAQSTVPRVDPEILRQIRRLHFQTRRLADQGVMGSYKSAFRGRGIEFEEVREYNAGDDVRAIDWKVTARTGRPFVKSYREERELTVLIAVDISASTLTGTRSQLREDLIAKLGAVLTLIALNNNDKVGLVTFADTIQTYHPPRKARSAVWRILHEVLSPSAYHRGTDLGATMRFLRSVLKRRAIIFLISDFMTAGYERDLAVLAKRHDVTALCVRDPADLGLPPGMLLHVQDPETGATAYIDTADARVREMYESESLKRQAALTKLFHRHGAGFVELFTNREFIHDLKRFFEYRHRKELKTGGSPKRL